MKMRLILVAATLLLFCVPARADSTTVIDVVGQTCEICLTFNGLPPDPVFTFDAQFTVVLATGTSAGPFWDPGLTNEYKGGLEYEVTGVSGTFDGEAISLAPPFITGVSWINVVNAAGPLFNFGNVCFTASGATHCFENDGSVYDLLDQGIPMAWSTFALASGPATAPEPASFVLAVFGILALLVRRTALKDKQLTI